MSTQNELQVFENEQFGEVRGGMINGEPWFVAVDVCKALEISNVSDAMTRLDEDEKMTLGLTEGHSGKRGGAQSVNIINEAGLYTLVLRSRKAEAKTFRRWITHDVIPAIRKTGGFVADADAFLLNYLPNADEPTKLMFRAQLSVIRDLDNKVARQNKIIEEQVQEINTMEPKATYCDRVLATNNVVPITVIAKDYGMSAQAMNKKLKELGIQYECRGTWVPYAKYQGCGYTKTRTFLYDNGHGGSGSGVHTCWTPKGRMFLYNELKKEGILPVMEQDG